MIDLPVDPLSSYNVHQLQFTLESQDTKAQEPSLDAHLLYDSRRMSSSATSDSSSLQSRPDNNKRLSSPDHSPAPAHKRTRTRPSLDSPWSDPATPDHLPHDSDPDQRVQLPSLASSLLDHRRASLPSFYADSSASRPRLPYPVHRTPPASGLSSYQFPPDSDPDPKPPRPRLDTDTHLGLYPPGPVSDLSSAPGLSSGTASSFAFSPLSASDFAAPATRTTISPSGLSDHDSWAAASIARPNSPSAIKYDDSRSSQSMFAGVQRISGHSDRSPAPPRLNPHDSNSLAPIKSENGWNFPPNSPPDFSMGPSTSPNNNPSSASNPSISVTNSPTRSPQAPSQPNPSGLVDRPPQRKRGKLPKPVTDFLKDWLHRHSDHPYPSEEEKKQLCHATGLSMSQVSNWMINARRRILAPARHSTAGPTTTTPFATRAGPVGMGIPLPGMAGLGPSSALDPSRRMSVDSLQLYYPMSLQSLGHDPHSHHMSHSNTRHMVGITRSLSSSHATAGNLSGLGHHGHGQSPYALSDPSYAQGRLSYGGGGGHTLHPSSHGNNGGFYSSGGSSAFLGPQSSIYSGGGGYAQSGSHHAPPGGSPGARVLTPGTDESVQTAYRFPEHSVSPGPGSGYATPQ